MSANTFTDNVRQLAAALLRTGTVLFFRAPDGGMAAAARGHAGFGPDRDAALCDLARRLEFHGVGSLDEACAGARG